MEIETSFLPVSVSTINNESNKTKCCKSGWRMCKTGEWKLLVPRGKRRTVYKECDGKLEKESIWVPPVSGPLCMWISITQYQNGKRKRSNQETGQICNNCGTHVAISHDSDVCPKCQMLLANLVQPE